MKIRKKINRILSICLAMIMLVAMIPSTAFATNEIKKAVLPQLKTITEFGIIDESFLTQNITIGSSEKNINLPTELKTTYHIGDDEHTILSNPVTVTWISDKEFSSEITETFLYSLVISDVEYMLGENTEYPTITVNVIEDTIVEETLEAETKEQFPGIINGETYYFDLSGEKDNFTKTTGNPHTIKPNTDVPDETLNYVPFTYTGTINAYSLNNASQGLHQASASASESTDVNNKFGFTSDRSLFVSDYNIVHNVSWNDILAFNKNDSDSVDSENYIFGKNFDTYYSLRSLSISSSWNRVDGISPANNEWDEIVKKSQSTDNVTGWIKNFNGIYSLGQDTDMFGHKVMRGNKSASAYINMSPVQASHYNGFRPALEVMNPTTLGADGLKEVVLDLNEGSFDGKDKIKIISAGESFIATNVVGLTRPAGNTTDYFSWNTAKDGTGTDYAIGEDVPNTVTTLYAQWVPLVPTAYNVTFNTNGGTPTPADQTINEGENVTVVNNPTKFNYIFDGWYDTQSFENKWDFGTNGVTGNMTLFAKWDPLEPTAYNVTFNTNGGTPTPADQTIDEGKNVTVVNNPTKFNYIFDGWYDTQSFENKWDFGTNGVTGNMTLFAKWVSVEAVSPEKPDSNGPNTGDSTNLLFLFGTMFLSAVVLLGIRKKVNK